MPASTTASVPSVGVPQPPAPPAPQPKLPDPPTLTCAAGESPQHGAFPDPSSYCTRPDGVRSGAFFSLFPDNTIAITDDTYLSGHHAKVSVAGGQVIVDDLASRNGTYLNGSRITDSRSVKIGDRIQIGYTVFEAQ